MTSRPRAISEGGFYHVYARGVGGQIVYEDDADRKAFLVALRRGMRERDIELHAWCLMDNHFHLLVRGDLGEVSGCLQAALSLYARSFNLRYGRKGHVFQGPFGSQAIADDAYFLQAMRYIHQNPERGGIASVDAYRWSSYREYVGAPVLVKVDLALAMLGSVDEFVRFHRLSSEINLIEPGDVRGEAAAKRALQTAIEELGFETLHAVRSLSRAERDSCLARLRARGLTTRQIARITGVSQSIVVRA